MTHETHNIEYKQSWRDEYLKWVCGFANADGGVLYIEKDDDGNTVGVADAKRLLEDIPNKIQTHLGIVCDVRPHEDAGGECIEINVDPSPYPVNYKGESHYRSGATKQVLKGNALTRFIFDRTGLSSESVPVGDVDPDDLWRESFSIFRTKALESGRMTEAELSRPDWDVLDKLGLVSKGQLNRAGYIESRGRGIDKIREACEANGNPMVEFVLDDSGVMARLDAPSWWNDGTHAVRDVENEHGEQVNEQVNE